ncbi:MAG: GTPase RsgA [Acidilobus sp.]
MLLADWRTLARIIRRSDAVLEVVDARDPDGTRSRRAESIVRAMEKGLLLVINKIDLIPRSVVKEWLSYYEDLGLRAVAVSSLRGEGKGKLLKAMEGLTREKGSAMFAVVGYPKTGKSSVINLLKGYKSAPISKVPGSHGYTRGYVFYRVAEGVYVIDTPGTIPVGGDPLEAAIRGRSPEEMRDPVKTAVMLLKRALSLNPGAVIEAYGLDETDPYVILGRIAERRSWFYRSTHEPNIEEAARAVIRDYHIGRLRFYVPPPRRARRTSQA